MSYFFKRVLSSVPILLIASIIIFGLIHITPGDAAFHAAGGLSATQEDIEAARDRLGLDRPVHVQYLDWAGRAIQGDLGTSLFSSRTVTNAILDRLPVTVGIALGALVFASLVAFPLGIAAALKADSTVDRVVTTIASLGIATPEYFLGLILVLVFALRLDLLPATGYVSIAENPADWLRHIALPSIALGGAVTAELTRHVRASLRDVLSRDYVLTAFGKGLPTFSVIFKHAMKNAAIPVVTVFGLQARRLLGGTVVVEQVFGLRGLGHLAVHSVFSRDIPMIQGVTLVTVVIVVLVNLLVDLSYLYFNPRVRDV